MSYDHVLDELEIGVDPFAMCELRGSAELALSGAPAATLHYIVAGDGAVAIPGRPPIPVRRGSMVLIPALRSHVLRSAAAPGFTLPVCTPAELGLEAHEAGAAMGDGGMLALCVRIVLGLRGARDLVDLVRTPLVEAIPEGGALDQIVGRLLAELRAPRLGSRAMLRALMLECMIELLRGRLEARDPALGWMAALKDRSIWQALRDMLEEPGAPHSVETLAAAAGLGRSTFAKRFTAAYGSGPMELLRDLRMHRAADLLANSDHPVEHIARAAGFRSRSAFSRAFAIAMGASPGVYRAIAGQPDHEAA